MAEYKAVYKCRLCGELFEEGITGEGNAEAVNVALTVDENFYNSNTHTSGHRHMPHYCKDGSFGFADFQGFRKTE